MQLRARFQLDSVSFGLRRVTEEHASMTGRHEYRFLFTVYFFSLCLLVYVFDSLNRLSRYHPKQL
jgi:hypothetical protein